MKPLRVALVHGTIILAAWGVGLWLRHRVLAHNAVISIVTPTRVAEAQRSEDHSSVPPAPTLHEWSKEEWDAATAALHAAHTTANPLRARLGQLQRLLAAAHTSDDCARLAALFNEMPDGEEYAHALQETFKRWGKLDPEEAMRGLEKLDAPKARWRALEGVMSDWAIRAPSAALTFLRQQPGGTARSQGPSSLLRAMARRDPEGTVRWAQQGAIGSLERQGINAAVSVWIQQHPDEALALIPSLMKSYLDDFLLDTALQTLAREHPAKALAIALEQPTSPPPRSSPDQGFKVPQDSLVQHVIRVWAQHDPEAALQAILEQTEGATQEKMLHNLGDARPLRPVGLIESLPEGAARAALVEGIIAGRLEINHDPDPAVAAHLALTYTTGDQRLEFLAKVGTLWPETDAPAASAWLSGLEPGPDRDAAVGGFVRSLFGSDPEAALIWSTSIADESQRRRHFDEWLPQWLAQDREAACQWIETTDRLSDAARHEWLGRLNEFAAP